MNPTAIVIDDDKETVDKNKEPVLERLKPNKVIIKPFDMDEILDVFKDLKSQN